jgi:hypothetical protein
VEAPDFRESRLTWTLGLSDFAGMPFAFSDMTVPFSWCHRAD